MEYHVLAGTQFTSRAGLGQAGSYQLPWGYDGSIGPIRARKKKF
jgi:hypothetical protein